MSSASSHSVSSRSGDSASGAELPARPLSSQGQQTVVNPERRPTAATADATPSSNLFKQLFPESGEMGERELPRAVEGVRLGHFLLEERIGMGGMGAVFRAVDERLQRVVALKVLAPPHSRDPASVQRFVNEARAAAHLDDDHIARVFYMGEDQGLQFIAFEFVTGANVRDLIQEAGRLDPADAVNYTLQLAVALKQTSAAGVIHRDIKPSNVIITPAGRAKLVDLGLAKKPATDSQGDLTVAGTTLGTFDYISPEQAKDPRNVDVRSDIYSLGCTLYHMLTGEPPYSEGTMLQKLLDHQGKDPPDPAAKNPRVSRELSAIVRKMMASDPRGRYATPEALIRDLVVVAGGLGLRGMPAETLVWTTSKAGEPKFWERNLAWIGTTVVLLLFVFTLDWWGDPKQLSSRPDDGNRNTATTTNDGTVGTTNEEDGQQKGATGSLADGSSDPSSTEGSAEQTPGDVPANQPPLFNEIPSLVKSPSRDPKPSGVGTEPSPAVAPGTAEPSETVLAAMLDREPVIAPKPDDAAYVNPTTIAETSQPAITIFGKDGTAYPTLEAACNAAGNGDEIVLRFDGPRPDRRERPLEVAKKNITIRAADGFRPVLIFRPGAADSETQMMTLVDAQVRLINVDLRLELADATATAPWSLISMQGADHVSLQGVTTTIVNPYNDAASVIELVAGPGARMDAMKSGQPDAARRFSISVTNSFLRGECDLVVTRHNMPGWLEITNSVVALDGEYSTNGSLLKVVSGSEMLNASSEFEVRRLEHVTALLSGNLLSVSGDHPKSILPIRITAVNDNLVAAKQSENPAALVLMSGDAGVRDFRGLLIWNGLKNFYDRFETYWLISSNQGAAADPYEYERWVTYWKEQSQANEINSNADGVRWKNAWREKSLAEVTRVDLELDDGPQQNPEVNKASDGTPVGADFEIIPSPWNPPAEEEVDSD